METERWIIRCHESHTPSFPGSGSRSANSYDGLEWNFTATIRQRQPQALSRTEEEDEEEKEEEEEEGRRRRDTLVEEDGRRHTLVESEGHPMVAIDDTAFVAMDNRSSIVVGRSDGDSRKREEGEGEGEGGKSALYSHVPERTQGDGQEAESPHKSPHTSALQHIILPLMEQVRVPWVM